MFPVYDYKGEPDGSPLGDGERDNAGETIDRKGGS